eukprot:9816121-Prorocentrum_lima.AAC.1
MGPKRGTQDLDATVRYAFFRKGIHSKNGDHNRGAHPPCDPLHPMLLVCHRPHARGGGVHACLGRTRVIAMGRDHDCAQHMPLLS